MAENLVKAKSWFQKFAVAFTLTGGPAVVIHKPTAASQTIKRGDPLTISAGEVSLGASDSGSIYGIAMADVTTTAADEKTEVAIAVADRNTVFVGQADDQTDSIADGAECDIVDSGTKWLVDVGSSTEDVCLIVGHVPGDVVDDATTAGRLYFIWKRSSWDVLVAAL